MSETFRYSPNEFLTIIKEKNFIKLKELDKELDDTTKTSIKDYYTKINMQKNEKKTLKCEDKLSYSYTSTKNNLTKKHKKEQEVKNCKEIDSKAQTENTTLLKQIYNNLIKYYKMKLNSLIQMPKPKDKHIYKIAEYISNIQSLYLTNCNNRLSIEDLIHKMKTSNKLNKLNDNYIEYIMYKRDNAEKVIKYLNKISSDFITSLTTIITQLPECSGNQSNFSNRSYRNSRQSYV